MSQERPKPSRRRFLQMSALGAGVWLGGVGSVPAADSAVPSTAKPKRPNFLLIITDQQGLDTLSGLGNRDIRTPNMDRLVKSGVSFLESHSANPVCSPARSSIMTGWMPTETGVVSNNRPIHERVPHLGKVLGEAGYETVYAGKWHLPYGYPTEIPGFRVLPVGGGQGDLVDTIVSRSCEAYLRNRSTQRPFFLVASLLQPHDICYWAIRDQMLVPPELPFPQLKGQLPELPPNHRARPKAPERLDKIEYTRFNEEQWRYYNYIYNRQVEMVDADIGRILDALEGTGEADNTIVCFTADHGDGRGRHSHVSKWYPYDESVKVPMIFSCPQRLTSDLRDRKHLVSGIDVLPTLCDFAGVKSTGGLWGRSLRPLLEGKDVPWRDFLVMENHFVGRTVRTSRYKYVHYKDDPVEQLFDMQEDPWEIENLYQRDDLSQVLQEHRGLLAEWNSRLNVVDPTPEVGKGWRPPTRKA